MTDSEEWCGLCGHSRLAFDHNRPTFPPEYAPDLVGSNPYYHPFQSARETKVGTVGALRPNSEPKASQLGNEASVEPTPTTASSRADLLPLWVLPAVVRKE